MLRFSATNGTFRADEVELSGITAEVARRQPDGRWLYVIDNPYAVALPEI